MREQALETFESTKTRKGSSCKNMSRTKILKDLEALVQKPLLSLLLLFVHCGKHGS